MYVQPPSDAPRAGMPRGALTALRRLAPTTATKARVELLPAHAHSSARGRALRAYGAPRVRPELADRLDDVVLETVRAITRTPGNSNDERSICLRALPTRTAAAQSESGNYRRSHQRRRDDSPP